MSGRIRILRRLCDRGHWGRIGVVAGGCVARVDVLAWDAVGLLLWGWWSDGVLLMGKCEGEGGGGGYG